MGKHKPTFAPGFDGGDFVLVTNAAKVRVTGRKEEWKLYRRHTGHLGGLIEEPLGHLRKRKPTKVVELAVKRMLPKTTAGEHMLKRLKVYAGSEHPHQAQQPKAAVVPMKKRPPRKAPPPEKTGTEKKGI
jgi:large subunit ribosomal protein L13